MKINLTKLMLFSASYYFFQLMNPQLSNAQTNVALTAVPYHSSGGNSAFGYGPDLYNDGIIPIYTAGSAYSWAWINSGSFIEYTWTTAQTIDSITFHNGGASSTRHFSTLNVEYWNGSTYVSVGSVNGNANIYIGYKFPNAVTTTKLRFSNILGGTTSPSFREIECWQANSQDVSITGIITPTGSFCSGMHEVKAIVRNMGSNTVNNFPIQWSINNNNQTTYTYSGTLQPNNSSGRYIDTVVLGTVNFPTGSQNVRVWSNLNNDINRNNDSASSTVTPTSFTVSALQDSICTRNSTTITLSPTNGINTSAVQWQESNNGSAYTNITTTPSFSYQTPALTTDKYYRALVTTGNTSCPSIAVKVNVVQSNLVVDLGPDTAICPQGNITLDAGNPGLNYNWNNNTTNQTLVTNTIGRYHVTVSDIYGCKASDTINLSWKDLATATFTATNTSNPNTYTFEAALQNVTNFFWDFGDNSPQSSSNPVNHTYTTEGNFVVKLHVFNECNQEEIFTRNISNSLSIDNITLNNTIELYPNPTNSILNVKTKNNNIIEQITFTNALGQIVGKEKINHSEATFDVSHYSKGIYIVLIQTKQGLVTKQVSIQ